MNMSPNKTSFSFEEWKRIEGQVLHLKLNSVIRNSDNTIDLKFDLIELGAACSITNLTHISE